MKKLIVINGSPRKKWNTATMLHHFTAGARSVDDALESKTYHLYDYKFRGCISCFACKKKGGKSYGRCAVNDDITKLLDKVSKADIVVFGSPVYFHDITAQLRGFLERLVYPYLSFDAGQPGSIAPKQLRTAFIYTMNVTGEQMDQSGYRNNLSSMENYLGAIFGNVPETLYAFNTSQYKNYSKYAASYWNAAEKEKYRLEQFPLDCRSAFDAGSKMAQEILTVCDKQSQLYKF